MKTLLKKTQVYPLHKTLQFYFQSSRRKLMEPKLKTSRTDIPKLPKDRVGKERYVYIVNKKNIQKAGDT